MKKFTKILSCLTVAAIICSAGALSACGSNIVSDEVTEEEWNAAFDYSSFYNCTIGFKGTSSCVEGTYYTDDSGNDYETTTNTNIQQISYYDLYSDESENVLGNVHLNATEYRKAVYDSAYGTEAEEYNKVYENYLMNESETVSYANKVNTNDEDGGWSTSSSSDYGSGFYFLGYLGQDQYFSYGTLCVYDNFEYVDGAYTLTIEHSAGDFLDNSIRELPTTSYIYEFSGGAETYSVKVKDGKVVSVKYAKSYSLKNFALLGSSSTYNITYDVTYEWAFSDYGTTTVTIPDEVTALFE